MCAAGLVYLVAHMLLHYSSQGRSEQVVVESLACEVAEDLLVEAFPPEADGNGVGLASDFVPPAFWDEESFSPVHCDYEGSGR